MHMTNELLSPAVATGSGLATLIALAAASRRIRNKTRTQLVPLMGVMGAFVFAAQMINFTLPAIGGVSDHLIGTVLLAILLGPDAAVVTMTGILVVQCLFFQDGGLLALGANILNMGVLPAYAGYALWRIMIGRKEPVTFGRLLPATIASCFTAVVIGAAAVCVEVGLSQQAIPPTRFSTFSGVLIGVHLVSGAIEGVITWFVVVFLYQLYPELSRVSIDWSRRRVSGKALGMMILVMAVVVGGVVSWLASPYADGLEWTLARYSEPAPPSPEAAARVTAYQDRFTPLPDYGVRGGSEGESASASWPNVNFWTSFSGVLGVGLTMGVIWLATRILVGRSKPETS